MAEDRGRKAIAVVLSGGDFDGARGLEAVKKDREAVFNDLEIRLLQQVANQCAIAIRQARLYQAAQGQVQELQKLNQLKDTPPNGQITVTAKAQSGTMQLSVSNSSTEIPASELAHIFEKFYRIPSSDPWKQGGTGLGLTLVQKLTEHLGGTIQVECDANQLTFTVRLPIIPSP